MPVHERGHALLKLADLNHGPTRRRALQRGQSMVVFAMTSLILIGVVGLTVNTGWGTIQRETAQSTADAVALGIAYGFNNGDNLNVATNDYAGPIMQANGLPMSDLTTKMVTTATSVEIQATVSIGVTSFFSAAFGNKTFTSGATAEAPLTIQCGLCIDGTMTDNLSATGNPSIDVTGTNIYTAGNLSVGGSAQVSADNVFVSGSTTVSGTVIPSPPIAVPPFPNPVAEPPAPDCNTLTAEGVNDCPSVQSAGNPMSPGVYNNITLNGSAGDVTMQPGIYVITGNMKVSSSTSLTGSGVMLYFTCSSFPNPCPPNSTGGSLTIEGGGTINLTPPTSGPYQGLLIYQDPNNNSPLYLTGGGELSLTGTIYAPSATLQLQGNSTATTSLNSIIDVGGVTAKGDGTINVSYNENANYVNGITKSEWLYQ